MPPDQTNHGKQNAPGRLSRLLMPSFPITDTARAELPKLPLASPNSLFIAAAFARFGTALLLALRSIALHLVGTALPLDKPSYQATRGQAGPLPSRSMPMPASQAEARRGRELRAGCRAEPMPGAAQALGAEPSQCQGRASARN